MLAYRASRTPFAPSEGMALDESYRHAHLPLVAPRSPLAIASKAGSSYQMGRHPTVHSVVLPLSPDVLEASPAYRELDAALRAAPFAHKIAWMVLPQRRSRLHATICGGYGEALPHIDLETRQALRALGPIRVDVRGLFSGNVNKGRLYLRLYPEQRDDRNLFHAVQQALGRNTTHLYVAGVWNLTADLDAAEAAALAALVEEWWPRSLLSFEARELWMLGARDDLVLDGEIIDRLALG